MPANETELRQWYETHGMEYLPGDWDERFESGESASHQRVPQQNVGRRHVTIGADEARLAYYEDKGLVMLLWEQREDHVVLEALEEFFAPYMSAMPHSRRRVLEEYLMDRRTLAEIADGREPEVSKQAIHQQIRRAVSWMVKTIADSTPGAGLYDDEELAWEAFNAFWERRFGTPWPLRG